MDVEQKFEGQARAAFNFDGRNGNELSLRRVRFSCLRVVIKASHDRYRARA
jgi:hypothetical protein